MLLQPEERRIPVPEETRAGVRRLVEQYHRNADRYRDPSYNETQCRQEFINPFFKALGWDMDNVAGAVGPYRDVIHEDALRIEGAPKAPDYSFGIGPQRKFYVEAKKPAVRVREEEAPAYQLRRYGWNAGMPLSILTDFEEFAIYDCRIRPKHGDGAAVARVEFLGYDGYLDRLDDLYSTFSPTALRQGSFDRYAEDTKRHRGTSEVGDAFLDEIEGWRETLARDIALHNADLSVEELNFAVQATVDRLLFLRIAEDRGVERYGRLGEVAARAGIYAAVCELYRQADEKYNAGLFHFGDGGDALCLRLEITDRTLKPIIENLYYPRCPYEFSVLPADILGAVYEQFLGKVIRLTAGHRAKVEEKPEVKKAGGVYYTPKYIVDYIVEHTVGEAVREAGTPQKVAKLRILDPACGSGSFLLRAYQWLLHWHLEWYLANDPEKLARRKRSPLVKMGDGDLRLSTGERKRILQSSIFGVDIDLQAVEVTKLNLLLTCMEGETEQSARQLQLLHDRVLPNIDANIKCGNSLIGPDYLTSRDANLFDGDEARRVNPFNWDTEFKGIMAAGGFDCVIGNPPYGAVFGEQEKAYLRAAYRHQTYQLDSYLLFMERALAVLLRQSGRFGMIVPNPWLTNLLQRPIRRLVTSGARVEHVVHFRFAVFPRVTVDTQIVIFRKGGSPGATPEVLVVPALGAFLGTETGNPVRRIPHDQDAWRGLDGDPINIFLTKSESCLARACEERGVPLGSICKVNVGIKPYQQGKGTPPQTRSTVERRPFDGDHQVDATYRPYLRGADITRYAVRPLSARFIGYGPWLAEPRPAADFDAVPKLFMRQTGDSLVAALDTERYLCLNNMHVIVPVRQQPACAYLLGIVNSALLNWFYHTLNPEVGEALAEVKRANVARLPIRPIDFSDPADVARHDKMVSLVERMLDLHRRLPEARTPGDRELLQRQITATDGEIDRLVYELYGLTEEEIAIVEGGTA